VLASALPLPLSLNPFVVLRWPLLFHSHSTAAPTDSAGVKFKKSLQDLVDALSKCRPSYVRCIKPNEGKRALMAEEVRHLCEGPPSPLLSADR
jgi:hypothetical protein